MHGDTGTLRQVAPEASCCGRASAAERHVSRGRQGGREWDLAKRTQACLAP